MCSYRYCHGLADVVDVVDGEETEDRRIGG